MKYYQVLFTCTRKSKFHYCLSAAHRGPLSWFMSNTDFFVDSIIYRDLKPDNIGIDSHGTIKIFDFGLAKELKDTYKVRDNQYRLSIAGTRRYMSPEVFLGELYGKPADIYSFALTMWGVVALRVPFLKLTVSNFTKKVMIQKKRPKLPRIDDEINTLIRLSWSHDPMIRHTASVLHDKIGDYISRRESRDVDGAPIPSKGTSRLGIMISEWLRD